MGTEKRLWEILKEGATLSKMHVQRVENVVKKGVPDVEGCINGKSFWLELKAGAVPGTDSSMVNCEPLKKDQLRFIRDRMAAGGTVWLLYRVGERLTARMFLIRGEDAPGAAPKPTLLWLKKHTQCGPLASPFLIWFMIEAHSKGRRSMRS